MKKHQFIIGSFACVAASIILFSCKKETSVQAPNQSATHPSSISSVVRSSFDSSVTTQPAPGDSTNSPVDSALGKLDWGYFYRNNLLDSFHCTPVTVTVPSGYNMYNTRVYMIGKDKSATQLWTKWNSDGSVFQNYYARLVHADNQNNIYTVLVISVANGKVYYATQQVTVTSVSPVSVTFSSLTETNESALAQLINSL